ncbi:hypothetical protein EJV47_12015 [Hymenobacter gummosus]|uniref:Uncharacterized protein n=1 Tax=Hymenobacter gummosus TaxID=1776032 RepID=A0A431U2H1_9BACT|nr:hypothetical protein [Hymenobacter gummosus]RTQ49546.1 hypothetical protein EJV47_12015 [Hymenobacter gummosus]
MHLFHRIVPVLLGLSSCAAPRTLLPGSYLETKPNVMLYTSRELVVQPANRVRYLVHVDDISMGREGSGTYRLRGRRLELQLNGQPDTATARTNSRPLAASDQQVQLSVSTQAAAGTSEPLPGLTVLVRDAAGAIVAATPTDSAGYAALPWQPSTTPQTIEITGIGWLRWQRPWPTGPTAFRVQMVPQPYEPYPAGTRKLFQLLAASPQQLVLLQGADTLTLVRQP